MASLLLESTVTSALQNILGAFFHGIEKSKLQLEVFSGNIGLRNTSPTTRITLEYFWEVLAFLVNSLVFLVIGLKINLREIDIGENILNVLIAIGAILTTRLIIVYGFGALHAKIQPCDCAGSPRPLYTFSLISIHLV